MVEREFGEIVLLSCFRTIDKILSSQRNHCVAGSKRKSSRGSLADTLMMPDFAFVVIFVSFSHPRKKVLSGRQGHTHKTNVSDLFGEQVNRRWQRKVARDHSKRQTSGRWPSVSDRNLTTALSHLFAALCRGFVFVQTHARNARLTYVVTLSRWATPS